MCLIKSNYIGSALTIIIFLSRVIVSSWFHRKGTSVQQYIYCMVEVSTFMIVHYWLGLYQYDYNSAGIWVS